jgi:hypothetical protein
MGQSDLRGRLFRGVLVAGAALAVACIVGNAVAGFPFETDLKWIALFVIAVTAFFLTKNARLAENVKFCVFCFCFLRLFPSRYRFRRQRQHAVGYSLAADRADLLFDGLEAHLCRFR